MRWHVCISIVYQMKFSSTHTFNLILTKILNNNLMTPIWISSLKQKNHNSSRIENFFTSVWNDQQVRDVSPASTDCRCRSMYCSRWNMCHQQALPAGAGRCTAAGERCVTSKHCLQVQADVLQQVRDVSPASTDCRCRSMYCSRWEMCHQQALTAGAGRCTAAGERCVTSKHWLQVQADVLQQVRDVSPASTDCRCRPMYCTN